MRYFLLPAFLLLSSLSAQNVLDERYHTYEEVYDSLSLYSQLFPNLAHFEVIGYSENWGYPIPALKISDNANKKEDEPRVLFNGVHHGEEVMGCEIIMELARRLLFGYVYEEDSLIRRFVDSIEIWLVPVVNVDGFIVVTTATDTSWRKNLRDNNENGSIDSDFDGVDLNRNYDFNWEESINAPNVDTFPGGEFYRGPRPFSERESWAIRNLCLRERFTLSVNYHSPSYSLGELVYYPWKWEGRVPWNPPDFELIQSIANEFAFHLRTYQGNDHYLTQYGTALHGNARNWMYGTLGTVSLTPEVLSYMCQPPPEDIDTIVNEQLVGVFWLLDRVLRSALKIKVLDSLTLTPIEAEVEIIEIDTVDTIPPPRKTDRETGVLYRLLLPGVYTLRIKTPFAEEKIIENVQIYEDRVTSITVLLSRPAKVEEKFNTIKEKRLLKLCRVYDASGRRVPIYANSIRNAIKNLRMKAKDGIYFVVGERGRRKVLILK